MWVDTGGDGDRWEGGHRWCWGIGGRVDTGSAGG